jgi:predicted nuclease of predicted toxin-antitoxin system
MRILFDNGTPRGVATALSGHTVEEVRARGWDTLRNGELLDAAEAAGFDMLLTTDRNIRYQQNLSGRKLAIVVLGKARWRLIKARLTEIAVAVSAATPGTLTEVEIPFDEDLKKT